MKRLIKSDNEIDIRMVMPVAPPYDSGLSNYTNQQNNKSYDPNKKTPIDKREKSFQDYLNEYLLKR